MDTWSSEPIYFLDLISVPGRIQFKGCLSEYNKQPCRTLQANIETAVRTLNIRIDQSQLNGEMYQFHRGFYPQLLHYIDPVRFDGADADV